MRYSKYIKFGAFAAMFVLAVVILAACGPAAAPTAAPATSAPVATAVPATAAPKPTAAPAAGVKVLRLGRGTYPSVIDPKSDRSHVVL